MGGNASKRRQGQNAGMAPLPLGAHHPMQLKSSENTPATGRGLSPYDNNSNPRDMLDRFDSASPIYAQFDNRELEKLKRDFESVATSDGLLQKKPFLEFFDLAERDPSLPTDRLFSAFSSNQKTINFREFLLGVAALSKRGLDEKLRFVFALFDVDGDGLIHRNELYTMIKAFLDSALSNSNTPNAATERMQKQARTSSELQRIEAIKDLVEEIMSDFDVNSDGKLSFAEWKAWVKSQRNVMDAFERSVNTPVASRSAVYSRPSHDSVTADVTPAAGTVSVRIVNVTERTPDVLMQMPWSYTVLDLKYKIEDEYANRPAAKQQTLIFAGQHMLDYQTLSHYLVEDDVNKPPFTINLSVRPLMSRR
eukprot:GILJ01004683.1.p1 GENE.GILJ01004683.1~~GILJ01004683.1.p1  ORF type:complete len:365 (+),score=61.76 GILJ01004683.1:123-1217(+)